MAIVVSACSTISEKAAFENVADSVDQRIGQKVRWTRDADQRQTANKAVKDLLVNPLTVDSAVKIALLNNRNLQATYADLGLARASLLQAGLLRNPIFDAAFRFPVDGEPVNIDLSVVFQFLDFVLIPLRREISKSELESAKIKLTGEVIDLTTRVRLAFHELQSQQQLAGLGAQVETASAASLEAARSLRRAGNITALEVATESVVHASAKLDLAEAKAGVVNAREALNVLMGLADDPAAAWRVNQRLRRPPSKELALDDIEERAVSKSLELAAARQKLTTFGHRFRVTKITNLLPDLELGAAAERDGSEREWDVGPSIAVQLPILDMGQARRAEARTLIKQAQDEYRGLAIKIRSRARRARARLRQARSVVQAYRKEILPLRREILQQTLRQYNAMQVGVLQLILAKQQQVLAGQQYIKALRNYWWARVETDSILAGRLPSDAESNVDALGGQSITSNRGGH